MRRRTLMRGLAAGLVSAPATTMLYGGSAVAAGDAPRRLVIYWSPNGTVPDRFFPQGSGDLTSGQILAPLADHADDLTVIRTTFGGTGDHKTGLPFSTTGRTAVIQDDEDAGISIDQEIANAIGGETYRASLTLAAQTKGNRRGYISANADGSRNPPIKEVSSAFEYMMGPHTGGGGDDGPSDLVARRSVLDTVMSDVQSLQARVSPRDKMKLEAHLEAIRGLEQALDGGLVACGDGNPVSPDASFDYEQRTRKHCELIAASFACDLTRVVSFMTAPAGHDNTGFGFLGVGGDLHQGIAHSATSGDQGNAASDDMAKIHTYHAQQLAYLIDLLKQMPEGDGTVFDNTAILWTNECSVGNHGHTNIPVVLAGSMGGYLRTGQYLPEELSSSRDYRSILATLANGMGHPIDTFGDGDASGLASPLVA